MPHQLEYHEDMEQRFLLSSVSGQMCLRRLIEVAGVEEGEWEVAQSGGWSGEETAKTKKSLALSDSLQTAGMPFWSRFNGRL